MDDIHALIEELQKIIDFKETTRKGDLVLVVSVDPQLIVYAIVNSIEKDSSHRDDWWIVTMHFLSLPPQEIIWTLREPQLTGQEVFLMQGAERFVKAVNLDKAEMDRRSPPTTPAGKNNPFSIVK